MRVHKKLSVKRNKTNKKRQQRNKRSTKSRVRRGGNRETTLTALYHKNDTGDIFINKGFERYGTEDYSGYLETGAVRLEPNNHSSNMYIARPAIYVHPSAFPQYKEEIENTIKDALLKESPNQISTGNSYVGIQDDGTLLVSSMSPY